MSTPVSRQPKRAWNEPPFTDADLDHHRRWLREHGQQPNTSGCAVCAALVERDGQ